MTTALPATLPPNDNPAPEELQLLENARKLVQRALPQLKRPADGVSESGVIESAVICDM
jgi:hypothetical protein